jgi:two-component system NarL family response regulator
MATTAVPLRIVIADDHALFRQGLRSLLQLRDDVTVVAEVERADQLEAALRDGACDVLLLDLQMERSSLVDIENLAGRVKVIVVTASERPEDALAAVRAGAQAVVFKRFAVEMLREAIQAVVEGHVWMPPALQAYMTVQLRDPQREALTQREREIVRHVALGLRNAEVGRRLFISEETVKTHLNHVFKKLDIRDRTELTRYAIRTGIIGLHERAD